MEPNEYIKANFHHMSDVELAEELGLTAKAIQSRRYRMRLVRESTNGAANEGHSDDLDLVYASLSESGDIKRISMTKYVTTKDKGEGEPPEVTSNVRTSVVVTPDEAPYWEPDQSGTTCKNYSSKENPDKA